ncbi:MAG: c-type cytochrome biogenesis protein CcmI [Pseudomonadales bacterium]|nr:c-type cytochrome biogenesis protein CcmI [Pseudomonadales bacterium]
MSFYFWVCLLLILAAGFVVIPYFFPSAAFSIETSAQMHGNIGLYEARLIELEEEFESELLSMAEYQQLKEELGLSLLSDTRQLSAGHKRTGAMPYRLLAISSAVLVCVASWLFYLEQGAWAEVEIQQMSKVLDAQSPEPQKVNRLVQLLDARLISHPEDTGAWYLLGHAHMKRGTFSQSVKAFSKLKSLVGHDVNIETSLVQAKYLAADGQITAQNREAMQSILKRAPHQSIILEMLAIQAFQDQDGEAAVKYLQQGLAGGLSGAKAASFRSGIQRARELAGMDSIQVTDMSKKQAAGARHRTKSFPGVAQVQAGRVSIHLSLDASIEASPDTVVFVIAREQGGMPMPLAVKRLKVGDLPIELELSDADAMMPSRLLSQFEKIELVARLSFSGQPSLQTGDLEVLQSDVQLAHLVEPIVLRLEP